MAYNEDGSVKDDGTLSGYYASRKENRLERQEREKADDKGKDDSN